MTVRTLTEVFDVAADGDTLTTIRVGPEPRTGLVELVVEQWSSGFRGDAKPLSVHLDPDDARALVAGLSAALEALDEDGSERCDGEVAEEVDDG